MTVGKEEVVQYFDYENDMYRQLYRDGDIHIDYADGSRWVRRGDSGDFNRI